MSSFPKWLLVLSGISLLPVLVCPLFIFVFPTDINIASFVRYVLRQLLWITPTFLFFKSLDYYYRDFHRLGIHTAIVSAAITLIAFIVLLA